MVIKIKQIANTDNFNQMLGSLGVNVEKWDIPSLHTEVVNKAEAGDATSVYKLINLVRHSEQEEIKNYALDELVRMGYIEVVEEDDYADEAVAIKVGDQVYTTLTEAYNVVENGGTIKLLKNCDSSEGLVVESGKTFTVDLNGHTLIVAGNVGSSGTKTNGFQLLKDSTVTFKNGTIKSETAKMVIKNYSNLTLDNVVIKGYGNNKYLVSNNYGNIVFKNGTVIDYNGLETCKAFDAYYGMNEIYDDGVTVTIADSTVSIVGVYEYDRAARVTEAQFLEKAKITVPVGYSLEALEGYEWTANGDGSQSLTKIAEQVDA